MAVIQNGGIITTTSIPAEQCTAYAEFEANGDPDGLPTCGGEINDITCQPASCTTVQDDDETVIQSTEYGTGEYIIAVITNGGILTTTSVSPEQCSTYAEFEADGDPDGLPSCGATAPPDNSCTSCGKETCIGSVVTYSYMTQGVEVVQVTTLAGRCITFSGGGGSSKDIASVRLMAWMWYIMAILSGIGMIVL